MKDLNRLHMPPTQLITSSHIITTIQDPLSECEILDLQDRFLSNGFQHIKVKNMHTGRRLVHQFLTSLSVYHDVACVTLSDIQLESNVTNVHYELLVGGYLDPFQLRYLEEFFIEDFYFDFMWIEATRTLLTSFWFKYFEKKVLDFKLEQHLPMIVISSENE